jgi:hypothetical protein
MKFAGTVLSANRIVMASVLAFTLCACGQASSGTAAVTGSADQVAASMVETSVRQFFDANDATRNGVLTTSESDAFLESTFSAADADDNRQISGAEWDGFGFGLAYDAGQVGRSAEYAEEKRNLHASLDADRSGAVSWQEFRSGFNRSFEQVIGSGSREAGGLAYAGFRQASVVSSLATAVGGQSQAASSCATGRNDNHARFSPS